jgi:hypothetical protein
VLEIHGRSICSILLPISSPYLLGPYLHWPLFKYSIKRAALPLIQNGGTLAKVNKMGVGGVLYYIFLPFSWLARVLLSIVLFIIAPFIHLGQITLYIVLSPYHALAKFEVSSDIAENSWLINRQIETQCSPQLDYMDNTNLIPVSVLLSCNRSSHW